MMPQPIKAPQSLATIEFKSMAAKRHGDAVCMSSSIKQILKSSAQSRQRCVCFSGIRAVHIPVLHYTLKQLD